jgi:16S rRNA (cytosine967-C5)-methyltransferase
MPRHTAWMILRSGSGAPLREVDRFARRAGLDNRDRGLVRRIVGTEVRHRGTLRALVARLAHGKANADLAAHLRIGFVQLFYLDSVPPHAAVSETVRAATDTISLARGRAVNGILRNALRAAIPGHSGDPRRDLIGREWHFDVPLFRDPVEHPLLWAEDALSMPAMLMKRWTERHGAERALALARGGLEEPLIALRIARGDLTAVAAELAALEPLDGDTGLRLAPGHIEALLASAAFREGRVAVQGETATAAAQLVGAAPGERVLDLCAAPGGKALVLAGAGADVVALDSSWRRLARLAGELERLALGARVQRAAGDGAACLGEALFDAVLVDAPCTNTGVLAARPGARWRFGPASLRGLTALQARLLDAGAARVRPGGRLVYSTCSLEPEENGRQVRAFLERHPGWRADAQHEALPGGGGAPGPVDGGFAALLVRPGDARVSPGDDLAGGSEAARGH